jgi:hypothetical protein
MADWATISSLATAGGTLVLAVATFASTRSANRSARVAELALQEQRRPTLVMSRTGDAAESIAFAEGARLDVPGGGAAVAVTESRVFCAMSLRNVGSGIAVLQAWQPSPEVLMTDVPPTPVEEFQPLLRDQYIAPGDAGLWQGALRDPDGELHGALAEVIAARGRFSIDLLYTDQVGGQRTISRFGVTPEEDGDGWRGVSVRHWYLDSVAPR